MTTTPDLLVDRYEVGRLLGAGGMAEVYEGRDRLLARRVAIKVLLPQYSGDPAFLARFKREAQSAASLTHPNIVAVYDTGVQAGTNFIVMEYVSGRTLRDVIRTKGPMPDDRVAEVAADVCSALAAAHARGIIHRDIKPANVMITTEGQVKVMDFGIARAQAGESITQTQAVVGTAQYISPEQAQGAVVDARTDLYSLGVCMYEMVSGRVPFTGQTPVAIAYQHVRDEPPSLRHIAPNLSASLESIITRSMSKDPGIRYQDAMEMRADLERARRGQQVAAMPMGMPAGGEPTRAMRTSRLEQPAYTQSDGYTQSQQPTRVAQHAAGGYGRRGAPPPQRGGGSRVFGWLAIALAVLLLAAGSAYAVTNIFSNRGPEQVAVPDVRSQPEGAASDTLIAAGFQINPAREEPNENVEAGLVINTDPPVGQRVDEGSAITLLVSSGRSTAPVPDVTNLLEADARQRLEADNLDVAIGEPEFSNTVPVGRVTSQDPVGGAQASEGDTVTIRISLGPETTTTTEPEPDDCDTDGDGEIEDHEGGDGCEQGDDGGDGEGGEGEGDGDGGGGEDGGDGEGDGDGDGGGGEDGGDGDGDPEGGDPPGNGEGGGGGGGGG